MFSLKLLPVLSALCIVFSIPSGVAQEIAPKPAARLLRVGATFISDPSASVEHFRSTALAIGEALNRPVEFRLYEVRQLEEAVRLGNVDLVFTGAGFFRRMETHGLRVLATEVSPRMSDPDKTSGTTFLVKKERTDLQSLKDLKGDDFYRILTEPQNAITKQYKALLSTEGVNVEFDDEALHEIARIASDVNQTNDNIGARRLYTVMEKLLEELAFSADQLNGQTINITKGYVAERLSGIAEDQDLSRYIL